MANSSGISETAVTKLMKNQCVATLFVSLWSSLAVAAIAPEAVGGAQPSASFVSQTEIQISLCMEPEQIVRALHLHPRRAAVEVWLFDDAALTLFDRGLRFRLRVEEGASELTLKVANQECAHLSPGRVPPGEGKCEYDMHGTTIVGAVSLTHSVGPSAERDLLAGQLQLTEALSAAQIRYLRDVVRAWPLPVGIRALGPQRVVSYGSEGKFYGVDVSQIPSGDTYVEISRKVPTTDAERVRNALLDELTLRGVDICRDQSAQAIDKLRRLQR
jgi:hypothetical protein